MDRDIRNVIDYVLLYAGHSTDWLSVKKEILWILPPRKRSNFSRRHYSTKKHTINKFELEVMAYWKKKTGLDLSIQEDKLHDTTWVRNEHGWGLQRFNEERKKARETKEQQERDEQKAFGDSCPRDCYGDRPHVKRRKKKSRRRKSSKRTN